MNLQTLRDTTNYGTFRTLTGGVALVFMVLGFLAVLAGVLLIAQMGWAAGLIVIYGVVVLAVASVTREAAHLVADIPDLLIQMARQQKATGGATPHPLTAAPPSHDAPTITQTDFAQFVDDELEQDAPTQDPQAMLAASRELLGAGKRDECKALLRELIRLHPQSPEADRARKALRHQGG